MGEGRAADNDLIVIKHQFVQTDVHCLPHQATGNLLDFGLSDLAQVYKRVRQIPTMVKNVYFGILAGSLLRR